MASLAGGIAGAAGGFATGGPVGAALAGLSGLLGGGGGQMSAAQQAAINQQRQIANQLYNYGASAPMTNQEDLNNLAQSLGQQGQQERSNVGALSAWNNGVSTGGAPAQMSYLLNNDAANRMAIGEQHMADAIAARRQALLQASGVNQQAFNMASTPGATPQNPLGQTLGNLAQAWAYKQAQNQGQGNSGTQPGGGGNGMTVGDWESMGYTVDEHGNVYDNQGQSVYTPKGNVVNNGTGAPVATSSTGSSPAGGGLLPTPGATLGAPTTGYTGGEGVGVPPAGAPQLASPPINAPPISSPRWFQSQAPNFGVPGALGNPYTPGNFYESANATGGAGDAPASQHDPMLHAMVILHEIVKHHLKNGKPAKKKRKRKTSGAGDMPPVGVQGMMGGGAPNQTQGAGAPGNEPGGANSVANQVRQPASAMLDRLRFPGGTVFPY